MCARSSENLDEEAKGNNFTTVVDIFSGFASGDTEVISGYPELASAYNDLSDIERKYNKGEPDTGLLLNDKYLTNLTKVSQTQSKTYMSLEPFTGIIKQFSNIANKHFKIQDEVTEKNIKFSYDSRINTKLREDDRVVVVANVYRDVNGKIKFAEALEIHQIPNIYGGELL